MTAYDGWRIVTVTGPATKAALLAALATELRFPAHFGANLDALADCLRDLDVPTLLVWQDWEALAAAEPATWEAVTALLGRRAGEGGFAVVLSASGREVGLPPLG